MIVTRWASALITKIRRRASSPTSVSYAPIGGTLSYTLRAATPADTPADLGLRVDILKALLERSDKAAMHVAEIRQRLLNYSLLIFGAVVAFSNSPSSGKIGTFDRKFAVSALVVLMLVFCYLDRRYHRVNHGWRKTPARLITALVELVNEPQKDVSFQRYAPEGEATAEPFYKSGQPMITWLLVLASIVNLARSAGWFGN